MATATTRPTEMTAPPPTSEPRQRRSNVRSRSEASDPPADDDQQQLGASGATEEPSIVKTLATGEDPWIWLANFPPDVWQHVMMYLYRTAPMIDRRSSGKPVNVQKYTTLIDQDRIMMDHGSGGYRLDVTIKHPRTGKYTRIGQLFFEILNLDFPPKVPMGDWMDEAANSAWEWARPKLEAEQATRDNRAIVGPSATEQLEKAFEIVERFKPAETKDGDDFAAKVIGSMTDLQKTLVELATKPKDTSEQSMLLKMLMDDRAAARQELAEMRKEMREAQKPRGFFEQIEEVAPKLEKFASILGLSRRGASAASGTDWPQVISTVVDKLSDNLPAIASMFRAGGSPGAGPASRGFTLNAVRPSQPTAEAGAQPMQPTVELSAEERTRLEALLQEFTPLLNSIMPFLIDHFRDDAVTGYDFRDWFIRRKGIDNLKSLKDRVGIDTLVQLSQLNEDIRPALSPPEDFRTFLEEVFTPEGDEETPAEEAMNG